MKMPRRSLFAILVYLNLTIQACVHPCDTLEQRVCEDDIDKKRCELIQEPERRQLLTRETCSGILETLDERR